MYVAATSVHGRRFHVAVSDEDMPKDVVCEIDLCRNLDALFHDVGLPMGASCHSDKTYREPKNRHYLSFLMLLVALQTFRRTMANFLRVGHSALASCANVLH